MEKSKIFLDLSKCREEEQKHIFSLLPPEPHRDTYNIFRSYKYLQFIPKSKFREKVKWMVGKQAFDKVELTYSVCIKLFEGGESKEDFAIYKRTFNEIPYPRVEWECNCGFKHCLNEGFERDYRKDNFKEIRLPTGRCLKCKKEIKTHSLESKEVLQVENKISIKEITELCNEYNRSNLKISNLKRDLEYKKSWNEESFAIQEIKQQISILQKIKETAQSKLQEIGIVF